MLVVHTRMITNSIGYLYDLYESGYIKFILKPFFLCQLHWPYQSNDNYHTCIIRIVQCCKTLIFSFSKSWYCMCCLFVKLSSKSNSFSNTDFSLWSIKRPDTNSYCLEQLLTIEIGLTKMFWFVPIIQSCLVLYKLNTNNGVPTEFEYLFGWQYLVDHR